MPTEFTQQPGHVLARPDFTRLDATIAADFRQDCKQNLAGASHLVVDLTRVDFIDSAGIGALVAILKGLGEGGRVTLIAPSRSVRTIFQITRLDDVFRIVERADQVEA